MARSEHLCVLVLAGAILAACSNPAPPPAATQPPSTATSIAPPTSTPTPTSTPAPTASSTPPAAATPTATPSHALPITTAVAIGPAGESPLDPAGPTSVDPASSFRVEIPARLPDARLLLLDPQEAMVAATGTTEVGASTRFTLSPAEPLRPGTGYALRVDSASGEAHDDAGRAYAPLVLRLRAAGDPPPPAPARRRHRHRK